VSDPGRLVLAATNGAVIADRVEPAMGFWARFRGLMGRPRLAQGEGLYLPDSSIHMFFMRFPIDALFLALPDRDGTRKVVAMRHELPPWLGIVLPVRGAAGVVELRAGTLRASGLQLGDAVRLEPTDEPRAG
jgi:uncharacterized protein